MNRNAKLASLFLWGTRRIAESAPIMLIPCWATPIYRIHYTEWAVLSEGYSWKSGLKSSHTTGRMQEFRLSARTPPYISNMPADSTSVSCYPMYVHLGHSLEFTKQYFLKYYIICDNSAICLCNELTQDSALSPSIILKPNSSPSTLGTAKQTALPSEKSTHLNLASS